MVKPKSYSINNPKMQYSRVENSSFLIRFTKELKYICSKFCINDKKSVFVVRLKMIETLATQAFKYSITIPYLTESEYVAIAEPLDDVYLFQSRIQLMHMANSHGRMVIDEYHAMRDALELIDARLKTIDVFGTKRVTKKWQKPFRHNNFRDKQTPILVDNPLISRSDNKPNYCGRLPNKSVQSHDVENISQDADADQTYSDFRVKMLAFTSENHRLIADKQITPQRRLQSQCDNFRGMYEYIAANAEYISLEPRFREKSKTFADKDSFMQVCIRKSMIIANEIRVRFANITKNEPNPALLESKNATLNAIQHAKNELFNYYLRNPVEII